MVNNQKNHINHTNHSSDNHQSCLEQDFFDFKMDTILGWSKSSPSSPSQKSRFRQPPSKSKSYLSSNLINPVQDNKNQENQAHPKNHGSDNLSKHFKNGQKRRSISFARNASTSLKYKQQDYSSHNNAS